MNILVGVEWYLIMGLMCISSMANDVEHLFIGLLAICVSSLASFSFKLQIPLDRNPAWIQMLRISWRVMDKSVNFY